MAASGHDSLGTRRELQVGDLRDDYFSLESAAAQLGDASRLPYSLKVLFENLLRHENGRSVTVDHLQALVQWLKTQKVDLVLCGKQAVDADNNQLPPRLAAMLGFGCVTELENVRLQPPARTRTRMATLHRTLQE